MAIQYVDQMDLNNKSVIARFDFNVPLSKDGTKTITDTTRIDLAIPTIKAILDGGAKTLVMMSHLGRPKGKVNPDLSLEPVATQLAKTLGEEVTLAETAHAQGVRDLLKLGKHRIILLENLRFHPEETANDANFASELASLGEVYINDAFGTAHRKHASTYQIMASFPKQNTAGGLLLKSEIQALSKIAEKPAKPFVGIIGGAKVSDKIKTIEKLMVTVDALLIGGAMAYPFLKAKGHDVGKSLCSDDDVALAKSLLAADKGGKIKLPIDHIVAEGLDQKGEALNKADIPDGKMGLDIGPATLETVLAPVLKTAKTVFWNGPMGLFENAEFANGTMEVARLIANSDAFSLVGGGDSVSAVKKSGQSEKFSHVSTGGGASLEFIENGTLPGIQGLRFGVNS